MKSSHENKDSTLEMFKEWTESITMHGFPNIFRTKYLLIRIMWIFLFMASISGCFFIITLNLLNYLNFDVITKIRMVEKDSLVFPAVTICNMNPFTSEQGLEYVGSFLNKSNLNDFTSATIDPNFPGEFSKFFFNYNLIRHFLTIFSKSNSNEQKKNMSFPFDKIFISCLFNLRPCSQNDWTWFYDAAFGNCYRFNSDQHKDQIKNTNQHGKYNGLMIEMYVGIPEEKETLSLNTGAHVYINDNSIKPMITQGVDIAPGFSSNLVLERIKKKLMPKPYSECVDNLGSIDSFYSEYYKKVIKSNLTYNQNDCFAAYIKSEVYKKCKCDDLTFNLISENNNNCDDFVEQSCSFAVYQELTNSSYKSKVKSLCPLECESISYSIRTSFSRYPSVSYAKDLIKTEKIKSLFQNRSNISIEEFRENILSVNVYYEELKETEITENRSISWDSLVSSIGGTLGLFLGISFLSFAEFIDLLIQIVFLKIRKNKTKVTFLKK